MSGIGGVQSDLQTQLTTATGSQSAAQTTASNALSDINNKWVPKPNPPFASLSEAMDAINSGRFKPTGFGGSAWNTNNVGTALKALNDANSAVADLNEAISSLGALKKLLDSGDIEGAVMLLQTSRAKNLEKQLGTQIQTMQDRNARITILNNQLKDKQVALGNVGTDNTEANNKARAKIQGEITDLKSQIDTLNSDSQIDMIRTQSLVNKRNEAFDTLTNLLGKFQKTIDGIVGNYR